jgi:hypothetical protein
LLDLDHTVLNAPGLQAHKVNDNGALTQVQHIVAGNPKTASDPVLIQITEPVMQTVRWA